MRIEKVEIRSQSLKFRDKAFTFRCLKDVTALMFSCGPFQRSTLLRSAVHTHLPALVQHLAVRNQQAETWFPRKMDQSQKERLVSPVSSIT